MMDHNSGSDYQSNGLHDPEHIADDAQTAGTKLESLDQTVRRDEKTKFRAFVIAYNKQYGYLLLRAYKKGKGLHHQLPGGHLDRSEMVGVSFEAAAKRAALRELFEETGLKVAEDRLKFLKLGIKNRVYFQLLLTMDDSLHHDAEYDEISSLSTSLREHQEFYLKISGEHNGFEFERNIGSAIQMIQAHSGGKNSDALTVYSQKAKHERKRSRSHSSHSQSLSLSAPQSHKHSVSSSSRRSSRRKSSSSSSGSGKRRRKKKRTRSKEKEQEMEKERDRKREREMDKELETKREESEAKEQVAGTPKSAKCVNSEAHSVESEEREDSVPSIRSSGSMGSLHTLNSRSNSMDSVDVEKVGTTMDDDKLMTMMKGSGSASTTNVVDGVGADESRKKVPASMSRADALDTK